VLERLDPDPQAATRALAGIARTLPKVSTDQRRVLGFAPRLESGVALFDARQVFRRGEIEPGPAASAFYRLDLMQRGVQRWTQAYVLQQAYRLLFFHDLDRADPTPAARWNSWGRAERLRPGFEALLERVWPHSVGDEVSAFLEVRLPEALEANTGSKDLGVWLRWLKQHGEIGLDGRLTTENAYAAEVAGYEQRLDGYRAQVAAGKRAGMSVRAEEQRVRDIQTEYASFQRQVGWLEQAARSSVALTARARSDYSDALWLHAVLPLPLIFASRRAARWGARRVAPRRRAWRACALALGLWLPVFGVIATPLWVAAQPERAARLGERWLGGLRLLGRDAHGQLELRGAAAQLGKLTGWPTAGVD
jgi:hypothetical protein